MKHEDRIAEIEAQLADLKQRWPAHSVKPELIEEMERLEDELAKIRAESTGG